MAYIMVKYIIINYHFLIIFDTSSSVELTTHLKSKKSFKLSGFFRTTFVLGLTTIFKIGYRNVECGFVQNKSLLDAARRKQSTKCFQLALIMF